MSKKCLKNVEKSENPEKYVKFYLGKNSKKSRYENWNLSNSGF